jgi:threonine/homoserine/homoserine lactone efflux protein
VAFCVWSVWGHGYGLSCIGEAVICVAMGRSVLSARYIMGSLKPSSVMDVLQFVSTVILITASGTLAPGPLFFATVAHGVTVGAKSGFVFSIAHSVVESTLILLLASGLVSVANEAIVKVALGVAGGVALLCFGAAQIRGALKLNTREVPQKNVTTQSLLMTGLAFTGLNPFFIVWWLTAGANLILIALEFASFAGVALMFLCHVWIDVAWLTLVAHLAKMGQNVVGHRWYRALMAFFGLAIVYYGLTFLATSLPM